MIGQWYNARNNWLLMVESWPEDLTYLWLIAVTDPLSPGKKTSL